MDSKSLFSLTDHLEELSKEGDPLEALQETVDFEYFRAWLVEGLGYGDGAKGGRPPFDPVMMFKALILQAQHNLSDARMEFMIRDRLSWLRFLGLSLGDRTPDENTIRHFRNRLTETGTLKRVMKAFDWQLQKKGYIPMSGQRTPGMQGLTLSASRPNRRNQRPASWKSVRTMPLMRPEASTSSNQPASPETTRFLRVSSWRMGEVSHSPRPDVSIADSR
ncbi:transposase [Novosphingobium fluoreni]|uniref:Transposase n=1 Tax=Novosphingobium fluoreni TaxID=1391222 RepID=A0A7W6BWA0_9SPHN|nr:transposase [Novosphingobium fluoreni]MBB3939109.1 transposase [Novosphingobium fluoreni]